MILNPKLKFCFSKSAVIVSSLVIIVMGLLLRLLPLFNLPISLIRHIPDDAFYLYSIATNVADKGMLSFDGIMPTTTARPLYILLLAGIKLLFGRELLPQLAFLLGALADIGSVLLLARLLKKLGLTPAAILLGAGTYLLSARSVLFVVNGMETPWALLAVVIYLNLFPFKEESTGSFWRAGGQGLALGAMMLLRLDFVFLTIPLWLGGLFWGPMKKRDCFISGAIAGLTIMPWILWSWAQYSGLMPPSGDALAMILGARPSPDWAGLIVRLEFLYDALSDLFPLVIPRYGYWLGTGLGLAFALGIFILRKNESIRKVFRFLSPLGIGLTAMVLYYGLIRLFWREWNLVVGDLVFALVLATIVGSLLQYTKGKVVIVALFIWLAGANLSVMATNWEGISPGQENMYRAAIWLRQNTPADTVAAAANGGILSWYSGRTIVDAAGIEDLEAYQALKSHRMYYYLKLRSVQFLIDPPNWPFLFYREYWGIDIDEKLQKVYDPLDENEERTLFDPVVYQLR